MKYLDTLKAKAKAALEWAGDEVHRRAIAGVIAAAIGWFVHEEVDSTLVDYVLLIVLPALLSMWSSRTPKLDGDGS